MQRHTSCVHHWVLTEPSARKILGVCRRCGARKSYPCGIELPEAFPDYEELDRSQPLPAETASPRERTHV